MMVKTILRINIAPTKTNLEVSRFGTTDHSVKEVSTSNGKVNLVSCSTVYHVKRVHLNVGTQGKLSGISIMDSCLKKISSRRFWQNGSGVF